MNDVIAVPDTRNWPPPVDPDERELLLGYLDYYRETILVKLDGLDREAANRRLVPSLTTPLSIVKHLTDVEWWWFVVVFGGQPLDKDVPADDEEDPEFIVTDDETAEQLIGAYRDACARSNEIIRAAASLDVVSPGPERPGRTLRRLLIHMIEETARHAGHADILRELIDGRTGN